MRIVVYLELNLSAAHSFLTQLYIQLQWWFVDLLSMTTAIE